MMGKTGMNTRRFSYKISIPIGLLLVALGTGIGEGIRSAVARSSDESSMAAIGAHAPKALRKVRASEESRLARVPLRIDQAMNVLSSKGRMGLPPELLPEPSNDPAPLIGWVQTSHDVPEWTLPADAGTHR
jgi:hypothetical protein